MIRTDQKVVACSTSFTIVTRVNLTAHDCSPTDPEAQPLLLSLGRELQHLTGSDGSARYRAEDAMVERAAFVIVKQGATPVGCGALRPLDQQVCEVKRVFAAVRGAGIGAAVLSALEARARGFGYHAIWLETRRVNAPALRFYEKHGYRERPNYGAYVGRPEAVCFEKVLSPG
jgi:ribosomal protein S18 acetylase RimI-like enzyme